MKGKNSISTFALYRKDTEHLYHAFVYSLVILLSGIYPFNIACYNYMLMWANLPN